MTAEQTVALYYMCCGVNRDELIVRLHPEEVDAALAHAESRPPRRQEGVSR